MKSTHATNRSRANSDPESLVTGREDIELRPMSIQTGTGAQISVDEWAALERVKIRTSNDLAAPNSPEIDATTFLESLATTTAPQPGAPRSTTLATTPKHTVPASASIRISRDVQPEQRDQPSIEGAARPGQVETSVGVTLGRQLTIELQQSDVYVSAQKNDVPGLEDVIEDSMEMIPTMPVAESPTS
jgi:hypothetical protein